MEGTLLSDLATLEDVMTAVKNGAAVCFLSSRTPEELAKLLGEKITKFDLAEQLVVGSPGKTTKVRDITSQGKGVLNADQIKKTVLMDFYAEVMVKLHDLAQLLAHKGCNSWILVVDSSSVPADVINFVLPQIAAVGSFWQIHWTNGTHVLPAGTMTV